MHLKLYAFLFRSTHCISLGKCKCGRILHRSQTNSSWNWWFQPAICNRQCMNGLRLDLLYDCTVTDEMSSETGGRGRKRSVLAASRIKDENLGLQSQITSQSIPLWNPYENDFWQEIPLHVNTQIITCSFQWWLVLSDAGEAITVEITEER